MHQSDRQTLNRIHSELHEVRRGIAKLLENDDLIFKELEHIKAKVDELTMPEMTITPGKPTDKEI